MDVERTSRLEAPAEVVWAAVLRTSTFAYVASPILRFPAAELADTQWMPGLELEDRLLLFGFVPLGRHHIRIESVDHEAMRLRTMEAGTIVGELGLYLGAEASASVVTNQPGTIYRLSADGLERMETTDPQAAAFFHKFIAQILSERLSNTTHTIQALLK